MGCDLASLRISYSHSEFSIETNIREWELKFGTFDQTLFEIISKINAKLIADSQIIPKSKNLIHYFNLELNEIAFNHILDHEVFKFNSEKDGNYDPEMVKILFFLLTRSNLSTNNDNQNQDKSKFLFSILKDDSEELDKVIDRESPNLINFLENCVRIACVSILGI